MKAGFRWGVFYSWREDDFPPATKTVKHLLSAGYDEFSFLKIIYRHSNEKEYSVWGKDGEEI